MFCAFCGKIAVADGGKDPFSRCVDYLLEKIPAGIRAIPQEALEKEIAGMFGDRRVRCRLGDLSFDRGVDRVGLEGVDLGLECLRDLAEAAGTPWSYFSSFTDEPGLQREMLAHDLKWA